MARTPFKLRSGNSTPFKMMGSSPLKQDEVFDQEKIQKETRINPHTEEVEEYATGYDADIDDIRRAKTVKAIHDDITGGAWGTRSGVTAGGVADKFGYSGKAGGAIMGQKGIYEHKYNVGNEAGNYASRIGGLYQGRTDIDIAKHILKENKGASELVKDIDPSSKVPYAAAYTESETRGLKYDPKKKKKE